MMYIPMTIIICSLFRFDIEIALTVNRLYLLEKVNDNEDCYCLIVVDFTKKQLYYIDPKCEVVDHVTDRAKEVSVLLNTFLNRHIEDDDDLLRHGPWKISNSIEKMHFPRLQNDFDSGMYVFLIMYFCVFECPVVFDHDDIICMRKQLAYWILKEYLPM